MIKLLTASWDRMVIPYNLFCCFELSPFGLLLNYVVFVLLIVFFWKLSLNLPIRFGLLH